MTYRCAVPGCAGHQGKFPHCLAQALWNLGDDYADETGGDSVEWDSYCMLFLFAESVWLSALTKSDFDLCDTPDFVIGSGTYVLLTESRSGLVFVEGFNSEAEARGAFDDVMCAYGRWSEVYEY